MHFLIFFAKKFAKPNFFIVSLHRNSKPTNMAQINFTKRSGIAAIHGKLGSLIFYTRNGKQYVRRRSIHEGSTREYREIIERITRVKP